MPSLHTRLVTVIGFGAVVIAGCPGLQAGDVPDSEVQRRIEAREGASQRLPERMLETSPPVTGEAPTEFVEDVREDVARRTGAATADLRLVRDQAMIWSDGSLGCPSRARCIRSCRSRAIGSSIKRPGGISITAWTIVAASDSVRRGRRLGFLPEIPATEVRRQRTASLLLRKDAK